jgi:RimJ/RimL family protein N-acetyltransferase
VADAAPNGARRVTVVESPRLRLCLLTEDDAPFMLDLLNQPSFIENIGDRGVRTEDEARAYIRGGAVASYERYGFGLYLVVVKDSGEAAGICGLVRRDGLDDVDIGFAFLPRFWKKGYAVESAAAVKAYAAGVVGLRRLVAITSPENWSSIRVLEKIGLSYETLVQLKPSAEPLKLFGCDLSAPGEAGRATRSDEGSEPAE